MRTCRTCGVAKPVDEFYYNRTRDSYHLDCKPCERERQRERYRTDPAYREQRSRQFRERYWSDAAYRDKVRRRERERYQTNPAYRVAKIAAEAARTREK